jgi:glycine cleavage system H protein
MTNKLKENNMNIPSDLKFTEQDEWARLEGDIVTIGISDFAQDQLSDIVYVEFLVAEGESVSKGDACATLESVKAAADVYVSVSGEVIEVNEDLVDTPEMVNSDPYGAAWMVKIKVSDSSELDQLMDAAAYEKAIEEKE